ncbi:MAG: hypothetical protein KQH67_01010 [Bacteroidetes bacterium]|nr:hypothetical protein [Bacteroidota bacterium]
MKKIFLFISVFSSIQLIAQNEVLSELLPSKSELKGFELKSEPEYYQGDDLFYLINGGADIYLEYGFKDVISASYENKTGLSFKAEIYQMLNDSAAYGIFSFNRNDKTIYHDIGDESIRQDDFLIFIKGRYYVVFTTQSNSEEQKVKLLAKARLTEAHIKGSGNVPDLISDYESLAPHAIYLRGPLAVNNIYLFDYTDIFQFADGIFFKQNDISTFIFNYPSAEIYDQSFQKVKNRLQSSTRFLNFEETEIGFSLNDKKGQLLLFTSHNNRIYVFIGKNITDIENHVKIIFE